MGKPGYVIKRLLTLAICLFICVVVSAQESAFTPAGRHEGGIDITNTITFLKKNNQSYLINYRYFYKKYKNALRAGINLDISNGNSEGIYPAIKLGLQKNKFDGRWNRYFGVDASFYYYKSTATPISTTRYGATPLVGVQYFAGKRLSASTEAGLNFMYNKIRSKNSFDPSINTSFYQINVGYVGMFIMAYHF
jgi:hypothetical protein